MFKVYVLDDKTELPKQGTYYIVAKDGLYLRKDTGIIKATVEVESIPFLKEVKKEAVLRLPKIPEIFIAQAINFFREIFEMYGTEAIVLGYYSRTLKKYLFNAPNQTVFYSSVDYEPEGKFMQGELQLVVSIHSHGDLCAFHARGDIADEKDFDGLHITIGNINYLYFTLVSSVAVNNNRFPIKPENIISGIKKINYNPYNIRRGKKPLEKLEKIIQLPNLIYPDLYAYDDFRSYNSFAKTNNHFFDLIVPNENNYRNCSFPKEWLDRVKENKECYNYQGFYHQNFRPKKHPKQSKESKK